MPRVRAMVVPVLVLVEDNGKKPATLKKLRQVVLEELNVDWDEPEVEKPIQISGTVADPAAAEEILTREAEKRFDIKINNPDETL